MAKRGGGCRKRRLRGREERLICNVCAKTCVQTQLSQLRKTFQSKRQHFPNTHPWRSALSLHPRPSDPAHNSCPDPGTPHFGLQNSSRGYEVPRCHLTVPAVRVACDRCLNVCVWSRVRFTPCGPKRGPAGAGFCAVFRPSTARQPSSEFTRH